MDALTRVGVSVDPADPTPPYEQLRRQLHSLIVSGVITSGTRLSPVRGLAADLSLAPGTVARTCRCLEAEGLVETRRGGGTIVNPRGPKLSAAQRTKKVAALAEDFASEARRAGATDESIRKALEDALA